MGGSIKYFFVKNNNGHKKTGPFLNRFIYSKEIAIL